MSTTTGQLAVRRLHDDNSPMTTAYIGIGSNVGDRWSHVRAAFDALAALPETMLSARSEVYETAPVGPTPMGMFLNAVAVIETDLPAESVLDAMQSIEKSQGRAAPQVRGHWGPRTLDLDLLLYGDDVLNEKRLTVPHPLMHERWFVLKPLADVAGEVVHPVLGQTVVSLLEQLEIREPTAIGQLASRGLL